MTFTTWLRDNLAVVVSIAASAVTGIWIMSAQVATVEQQLSHLNASMIRIEEAMATERAQRAELQLDMRTALASIEALREGLAQAWGQINRLSEYSRRIP